MSRRVSSPLPAAVRNPALFALIGRLNVALWECNTVLDVGCGKSSPLRCLPRVHTVGIDGHRPAIEEAQAHGTHDEYFVGDVRKLAEVFPAKRFDATIALDVIEHLPKEDGWRLMEDMEKLATRAVVFFTPNGFVPQHSKDGDLQEHLSGWSVQDFEQRGYKVLGMCGPKRLRGEYHMIKYRPRPFWALVSVLVDYTYSRQHPETAAALLAVKRLA